MKITDGHSVGSAYGLEIHGVNSPHLALEPPGRLVSAVHFRQTKDALDSAPHHGFGSHTGRVEIAGGVLCVDRDERSATLHRARPLSDELLVHPVLASVAIVFNWWLGRETLHAGAIVHEGRALGVLAPSHGGKTTVLAAAAAQGLTVLTDDTLILDGGNALRGPRSLDLRPSAAAHLSIGECVRVRRRCRVHTGNAPREAPLVGLVSLAWGRRRVEALPPSERYRRIVTQSMTQPPADAASHLAVAELPMWELRRPRTWRDLEWSAQQLAALAASAEQPRALQQQL